VFAPAYGSPFVRNLDEGRRYARIEDFRNFVKLAYMANGLHHSGGTICEPVDLPVNKRHFDMVYSHMKYSDKPFMGSVTAPERARDTVEMAKILFGADAIDPATGKMRTVTISLINANSPLTFDATMLGALKEYARANQATIVTPFILAGAMSPVTVAGTVAQTLAESLAGMTLTQLVNPGAPVVLGSFASSCRCNREHRPSARRSPRWCSTRWRRWRVASACRSAPAAACAARRSPMRRLRSNRPTR
jgi:trimethylamine--corrinoid protein Co-methyltransferase